MAARKLAYEKRREDDFKRWKALLEDAKGNVTDAAAELRPDLERKQARDFGWGQVRRLGLVDYARELRMKAGGPKGSGRLKR
jgi:hypothetical protein